jgi:hypothetical protein
MLICQVRENREINAVFSKAIRVLGHVELFEPIRNLLHRGGLPSEPVLTQQVSGTPGSPSATTTIDGAQLPPAPPKFGGKIEFEASKSTPY